MAYNCVNDMFRRGRCNIHIPFISQSLWNITITVQLLMEHHHEYPILYRKSLLYLTCGGKTLGSSLLPHLIGKVWESNHSSLVPNLWIVTSVQFFHRYLGFAEIQQRFPSNGGCPMGKIKKTTRFGSLRLSTGSW